MSQDGNGGKREEVPLERIVLSNMYSMEALIDVLAEKGLVSKEEVLKGMEKVVEGWGNKQVKGRNSNLICGTT